MKIYQSFCFDCGKMGHGIKACGDTAFSSDGFFYIDFLYSNALKVKSNLLGRENFQIGSSLKKKLNQCAYTGEKGEKALRQVGIS